MQTEHIFLIIILVFSISTLIVNSIFFYLFLKFRQYNQDLNKDAAEALGNTIKYVTTGFEDILKALQSMQEWSEKAHANIIEVENENASKIYKAILREQAFLGKLGEQFGYRPRTDLEE